MLAYVSMSVHKCFNLATHQSQLRTLHHCVYMLSACIHASSPLSLIVTLYTHHSHNVTLPDARLFRQYPESVCHQLRCTLHGATLVWH